LFQRLYPNPNQLLEKSRTQVLDEFNHYLHESLFKIQNSSGLNRRGKKSPNLPLPAAAASSFDDQDGSIYADTKDPVNDVYRKQALLLLDKLYVPVLKMVRESFDSVWFPVYGQTLKLVKNGGNRWIFVLIATAPSLSSLSSPSSSASSSASTIRVEKRLADEMADNKTDQGGGSVKRIKKASLELIQFGLEMGLSLSDFDHLTDSAMVELELLRQEMLAKREKIRKRIAQEEASNKIVAIAHAKMIKQAAKEAALADKTVKSIRDKRREITKPAYIPPESQALVTLLTAAIAPDPDPN